MLLLSLLVETGQLPGAGLTQADKTCIQLNFYLEVLKGGTWVSREAKAPPAPLPPQMQPCYVIQWTLFWTPLGQEIISNRGVSSFQGSKCTQ